MVALRIWLWRCTAARAFPALLAVGVVAVASRSGWQLDWRWASDWVPIMTYLTIPAAAGLVAFDRSRLVEPTMAGLGRGAPRGADGMVALVVASWLWLLLAWALTFGYVAVRAAGSGAVARPDPWSFVLTPVVLLAGAALGLLFGTVIPNLAAGPVAAVVTYLLPLTAGNVGLPWLMVADVSTGTLIGLERTPVPAAVNVAFHLVVAVACVIVASRSPALTPRLGTTMTIAIIAVVAASLLAYDVVDKQVAAWRPSPGPQLCLGQRVVVCGPAEAGSLLRVAHDSVESAIDRLGDAGIAWQTRYAFSTQPEQVPAGSGHLSLQPEGVAEGRMSIDDVVYTLQAPRVCAAYFADRPPAQLMSSQGQVAEWLSARLSGSAPVGRAPTDVVEAYRRLRACVPATPASRLVGEVT